MNTKLKTILLKIALVVVVLLFITTLLTKRFLYFRPSSKFLPVSETYKVIKQGHLHSWLAEGPKGAKIILMCHSNRGNISHYVPMIESLHKLGYSILAFDYSGFGKSGGIPSEQQLYADVSYMTALLLQTYLPQDIVMYGHGLGCPIATYAALRYNISSLILVSPFPGAATIIKNTPLRFLSMLFSEFQTVEYLSVYRGRSLLIHSVHDEVVPYDTLSEIKQYVSSHIPTTGTHQNTEIPWQKIKEFIDEKND